MIEHRMIEGRASVEIETHDGTRMIVVNSSLAHPAAVRITHGGDGTSLLDAESASALAGTLDRFVGTGSVAEEAKGGRRELIAGLIRLHDMVEGSSAEDTAIRYAIGQALDVASGMKRGIEPMDPSELATYGEPGKRGTTWILRYLDTDVEDMNWDSRIHGEEQAEAMARAAFHSASVHWNCTLLHTASLVPEGLRRQRMRETLGEAVRKASEAHPYGVSPIATRILKSVGEDDHGMGAVFAACRSSISRRAREEEQKLRSNENTLSFLRRHSDLIEDDEETDVEGRIEEVSAETESIRRRLLQIEESKASFEDEPGMNFLPIGSIVSTRRIDARSIEALPVAGSKGVVVGYSTRGDRCNVVAMLHGTKDEDGGTYLMYDPDDGDSESRDLRPAKFLYRRDELVVVANGNLVGSGENRTIGFHPTHVDTDDDDEPNMLVEAADFTWRIMMINDVPECTQIHDRTSYFEEWLTRKPQAE